MLVIVWHQSEPVWCFPSIPVTPEGSLVTGTPAEVNVWHCWWLGAWWSFLTHQAMKPMSVNRYTTTAGQDRCGQCRRGAKRLTLGLRRLRPQLDTVSARSQSTLRCAAAARNQAVLSESAECDSTWARADPKTPDTLVTLVKECIWGAGD